MIYDMFNDHLCFTMRNLYLVAIVATITIFSTNGEAGVLTACPAINGRLTTQLADPKNCTRFYKCNMGMQTLIECPFYKDEVHTFQLCFNPELGLCDWPWNVTCCSKDFAPGNGTKPTTTSDVPPGNEPTNKPFKCTPGTKRPYEGRCDLYYFCKKDEEVVMPCDDNQYFNPATRECDMPVNVPSCP